MACEDAVWAEARKGYLRLDRDAHCCRVENRVGDGTPDAHCCVLGFEWWQENKGLRRWPRVPADTPIKPDHPMLLTQKAWHAKHYLAGGMSWVLLGIREPQPEWLLIPGHLAYGIYTGNATKQQILDAAAVYALGSFPGQAILAAVAARRR
jgi:hypothetical protein